MPSTTPAALGVALAFALATVAACDTDDAREASGTTSRTTTTAAAAGTTSPTTTTGAPTPTTTGTDAVTTPPTSAPTTNSPSPTPWEPIGRGPFEVGVMTMIVDDPDGERPLSVDVWFPLADGVDVAALAPQRYTLLPEVYYESPAAFAAVAEQARPDQSPLVVYSHGSGGLRYIHSALTEAIASHGYVVAAPDHTGNTAVDLLLGTIAEPEVIAIDRPTDVGRVIDAVTADASPFAAQVAGERIAVVGHSLGAFTALVAVAGFENGRGTVEPDDRIDAIVALAPAASPTLLPDERLGAVGVPVLVVGGTGDVSTPVEPNSSRVFGLSTGRPSYRVDLIDAAHQTFTDVCAYRDALADRPEIPAPIVETIETYAAEGCSPGDMDIARATELTVTYVIGFLDEVLRSGRPIDPSVVSPPDDATVTSR